MQPADGFFLGLADALAGSWRRTARPEQLAPLGEWHTWLVMAGRGFGKTRTGAEWIHEQISAGARRLALVGPTAADVRDTMVEGESGVLATAPAWGRPTYEPSKRRLTWDNGAIATCFSAEEPERLRGPEHHIAWCDEVGAWQNQQQTWDMLQFGLRLGTLPRALVTTTPKPTPVLRALLKLAAEKKSVVVTRGRTLDNAANLSPHFIQTVQERYAGTRLGRQEMDGEMLLDVPGALWRTQMFDDNRLAKENVPELRRVVVAIDPSGTAGSEHHDAVGIVVAGVVGAGGTSVGYVLADLTCNLAPDGWARAAVNAYRNFKADRIIAERNFGGAMVEHVIRSVDPSIPYKEVVASRGKAQRAEPISAFYEQNRVRHAGLFPDLEDELCNFTTHDGYVGSRSPNRADALVWGLTELMLDQYPQAGMFLTLRHRG